MSKYVPTLKGLSGFVHFDWDGFAKGKYFSVTSVKPLLDYNTKEHIGTKVEVAIIKDETVYASKKDECISNRYKPLTFQIMKKDLDVAIDSIVVPVNPVATVYGEYRNQLSIKADDIRVLQPVRKP